MYTTLNCKTTLAQKIGLILFSTLNPTFSRIDPVHHYSIFSNWMGIWGTLKSAESCGFELSKKWGLFCLNSSNFMSLVMRVSLSHWDKCDPYEIELLFLIGMIVDGRGRAQIGWTLFGWKYIQLDEMHNLLDACETHKLEVPLITWRLVNQTNMRRCDNHP
jgi:hypothetical protein